ncbi:unnamed protein product [Haemonchus placei]|uniref:Uncharacterized protein n=1 Tax=Haemonchus placei TaxID=6290 RepID=A0A0N4W4K6_HAEPC|nr:unnamed protein product [Haemonchus placei]
MELERLYRGDHTFFKVIVDDFNAKIGLRRTAEELHIGTHGVKWTHGMGKHGSEGRRPLLISSPLCGRHRAYNTQHRAGGTNAGRIRQRLWRDRITTKPNDDDVHDVEKRNRVLKETNEVWLRAHLCNTAVVPAMSQHRSTRYGKNVFVTSLHPQVQKKI